MPNPNHRPASRTPSIPIPGASGRSIEDILNLNALGSPPSPGGIPGHRERSQSQQRALPAFQRALYSGIEGGRPSSTASVGASGSPGGNTGTPVNVHSRHASVGGSVNVASNTSIGTPWSSSRTASVASSTPVASSYNTPLGVRTRSISGFEPRIVRATGSVSASAAMIPPPRSPVHRRDSNVSTSPTLTTRSSRNTLPVSRSIPSSTGIQAPHSPHTHVAMSSSVPYGGNLLHVVPTHSVFRKPSYLQYSAMRDLICADTATPPIRAGSFVAHGLGSGRDVTPITESDDDSEGSTGLLRHHRSFTRRLEERERGRAQHNANTSTASAVGSAADPMINLPTRWNEQDRNKYLTVSDDGRCLHFHGPSSTGEKEAAAARANHPIPPACGIYYYEVTITDKGAKGHISVGFSCPNVRLNRLPGWEKESWGYHGDDGNSFASERDGTPFGPRFTTHDVIGCGVDFTLHKAFYTKNGALLGYAFENIGKDKVIYPSVGLRTMNEAIKVNFGQDPFKYDIDYHVHCAQERTWQKIQETPVRWAVNEVDELVLLQLDKSPLPGDGTKGSSSDGSDTVKPEPEPNSKGVKQDPEDEDYEPIETTPDYSEPITKLIMSYLTHHGYERTANAFKSQLDSHGKQEESSRKSSLKLPLKKVEEIDVDIKMETDDSLLGPSSDEYTGPFDLGGMEAESSTRQEKAQSRQRIVNAVQAGDIDLALDMSKQYCPKVLELENGIIRLKLRCRKFVELMLHASDAQQKMKSEPEASAPMKTPDSSKDSGGAMEVDDEGPGPRSPSATNGFAKSDAPAVAFPSAPIIALRMSKRASSRTPQSPALVAYQAALAEALDYGRQLQTDYRTDSRPDVQSLLKLTFSLVTYEDPRKAGGEVAELASQEARNRLSQEVNQAILESQGRPSRPALERLYRQTSASLTQLALMGVGEAAFADMGKEFLAD